MDYREEDFISLSSAGCREKNICGSRFLQHRLPSHIHTRTHTVHSSVEREGGAREFFLYQSLRPKKLETRQTGRQTDRWQYESDPVP